MPIFVGNFRRECKFVFYIFESVYHNTWVSYNFNFTGWWKGGIEECYQPFASHRRV